MPFALVRTEDGLPDYFISVIEGISGHKQAEAEREELRAQLTQAQRMESTPPTKTCRRRSRRRRDRPR